MPWRFGEDGYAPFTKARWLVEKGFCNWYCNGMWWYQSIHPLWNMGFGISSCVFTAKWTSCAQEAKPLEWSVVPHRAAESWNELAYDSEYVWHIWHELNLLTHVVAFYVLPFLTTGGTFCGSWGGAPARAGGKVRKNTGFRHSAIDWFPMNRAPRSPNQLKSEDAFFKILVDNGSFDLSCTKSTDGDKTRIMFLCLWDCASSKNSMSVRIWFTRIGREREILVVGREDIDNNFSSFCVAGNDSWKPQESCMAWANTCDPPAGKIVGFHVLGPQAGRTIWSLSLSPSAGLWCKHAGAKLNLAVWMELLSNDSRCLPNDSWIFNGARLETKIIKDAPE